jgi:hypothetical protein
MYPPGPSLPVAVKSLSTVAGRRGYVPRRGLVFRCEWVATIVPISIPAHDKALTAVFRPSVSEEIERADDDMISAFPE